MPRRDENLAETRQTTLYRDAKGRPTLDPAEAVTGEIVEYDGPGSPTRRTRFFLQREELPWLPVSEPAFLLWVLVGLGAVWLVIGLLLGLK